MENPYSLVFGKTPSNFIDRDNDVAEIIETFREGEPSIRTYVITGVRGCGKTVALSQIEREFRSSKDFIVLSLNSDIDLISAAAEELRSISTKNNLLENLDTTVSVPGITINRRNSPDADSPSLLMDKLLNHLTSKNKRVLFCVDEVRNNKNIRAFCQAFNVWLRKDYDVLFLLTGLKKNVLNLQNDNSVSFLKRAQRVELKSLNTNAILRDYQKNLGLSEEESARMALITKGYSYAFQLLGYLCYKYNTHYEDILQQFDDRLSDNVYDLIWRDLTKKEKDVLGAIIDSDSLIAREIMAVGGFTNNTYNQYRNILITKGIIEDNGYGKLCFALPRFREIASRNLKLGLWT